MDRIVSLGPTQTTTTNEKLLDSAQTRALQDTQAFRQHISGVIIVHRYDRHWAITWHDSVVRGLCKRRGHRGYSRSRSVTVDRLGRHVGQTPLLTHSRWAAAVKCPTVWTFKRSLTILSNTTGIRCVSPRHLPLQG